MFDVGIELNLVENRAQNGINSAIPLLVHYNGGAKAADGSSPKGGIVDTRFHRPNLMKAYRSGVGKRPDPWGRVTQTEFTKYVTFLDSFTLKEVSENFEAICPHSWM